MTSERQCDVCNRMVQETFRLQACGIETFACGECCEWPFSSIPRRSILKSKGTDSKITIERTASSHRDTDDIEKARAALSELATKPEALVSGDALRERLERCERP